MFLYKEQDLAGSAMQSLGSKMKEADVSVRF